MIWASLSLKKSFSIFPKQELKICANSHTAGAYFIQKALLDGKEKQEVSHQDLLEAQLHPI